MPTLTWRTDRYDEGYDEGFVADSTRRVPEGMAGAYYWVEDDRHNPGGPDRDPGWSLVLVTEKHKGDERHETVYLGHYADADTAKAAAELYEETGVKPAEARPTSDLAIPVTYNAPEPGQRDPNPQVVRDSEGRVRVHDPLSDRYGWAALDVTWEPIRQPRS